MQRDNQGRELVRTSTHMRAAFGDALITKALTFAHTDEVPLSGTYAVTLEAFAAGAGRRKVPAWRMKKGAR
ncbi:hypothetical protein DMC25_06495 [Caulobacter sp. D4A]|uniref:hypothetical protein n=1 Tax=unclassified Caulobacter TaxID=2648921 RepID=UPI000D735E7F|nr:MULTISPECIES: hypothetical protein [unclassified Caulobacter]PXA91198.1 hypothetical protein DMC25_06495 [Caulobacter sp. D4A]PXA96781.1 hypothetical protein DMC18_00525 [Caulobacter sp. D5]